MNVEGMMGNEGASVAAQGGGGDGRVEEDPLGGLTLHVSRMVETDFARLRELAETFPTLRARFGHELVDSLDDLKEIAGGTRNNGPASRMAAAFLLEVWDPAIGHADEGLRFDIRFAWASWDGAHRAAWQAWAARPWFA